MKTANLLIIAIIALLSVAAGLAKVMHTQREMEFLQGLGLSTTLIMAFGLVQIIGGVLLVSRKTRMPGAILVILALVVSTALLFIAGNTAFGWISVIPVALAGMILYQNASS